jgi:hypothetical protein
MTVLRRLNNGKNTAVIDFEQAVDEIFNSGDWKINKEQIGNMLWNLGYMWTRFYQYALNDEELVLD